MRARLAHELRCDARTLRPLASTIHAEALRSIRRAGVSVQLHVGGLSDEELIDGGHGDEGGDGDDLELPEEPSTAFAPWDREFARSISARAEKCARTAWQLARVTREPQRLEEIAYSYDPTQDPESIATICRQYENWKRAGSPRRVDFTDLLTLALELGDAPTRSLLVVDEVQDCSELQWRLIDQWAERAGFVVLIGDPDQCIHEWCGASTDRWSNALTTYEPRRLAKSHRVPKLIHQRARRMIMTIPSRTDAPYEPTTVEGRFHNLTDRAALREILDAACRTGETAFILAPTWKACREWANWAIGEGLPAASERGGGIPWSRTSKRILRALTALLARREPIPDDLLILVANLPADTKWFTLKKKRATMKSVGLGSVTAWITAGVPLDRIQAQRSLSAGVVGLDIPIEELAPLARIADRLGSHVLEDDFSPPVTITTWHASKGREADVVVVDFSPSKFVERQAASGKIDGWTRAAYVALTRTRRVLVMWHSALEELLRSPAARLWQS